MQAHRCYINSYKNASANSFDGTCSRQRPLLPRKFQGPSSARKLFPQEIQFLVCENMCFLPGFAVLSLAESVVPEHPEAVAQLHVEACRPKKREFRPGARGRQGDGDHFS